MYGAPNERANWQTISTISAISAIQIFPLEAEPIYSEAIPTHVSNHLRAIQSYPYPSQAIHSYLKLSIAISSYP